MGCVVVAEGSVLLSWGVFPLGSQFSWWEWAPLAVGSFNPLVPPDDNISDGRRAKRNGPTFAGEWWGCGRRSVSCLWLLAPPAPALSPWGDRARAEGTLHPKTVSGAWDGTNGHPVP